MSRTAKLTIGVAAALLVLAGAAYGAFALVAGDGDTAAPVSLSESTAADATSAAGANTTGTADGTWTVSNGSFVGYRVREKLAKLPAQSDAVGRTEAVTGTVTIAGDSVTAAGFTADMTQLTSDERRRDNRLRDAGLQTDSYPQATFELTEAITLPEDALTGAEIGVDATGELTLHGQTRPVTLPLQARVDGERIEVVGSLELTMTDYGIEPPSFAGIVEVGDKGTLELKLVLTQT